MASELDNIIKAQRFNDLKAKVKEECLRRSHVGSVAAYGGSDWDFSTPASADRVIDEDKYRKISIPMRKINWQITPNGPVDRIINDADLLSFETNVAAFKTRKVADRTGTDCVGSSCTGLCYNSCETSCSSDCTGDCDSCTGSCEGSCKSGCKGGCTSCSGSCGSDCTAECSSACHGKCGNGCEGSCTVQCATTSDSSGGCSSGSDPSGCTSSNCTGTCSGHCTTGCSSNCEGGCWTKCGPDSCGNNCQVQ